MRRPAARLSLPGQTPAPKPVPSLSSLLKRIKQEAQARRAPLGCRAGLVGGHRRALARSGIPEDELIQAFTACIESAPERVTFFPRDFLKMAQGLTDARTKAPEGGCGAVRITRPARGKEPGSERSCFRERDGSASAGPGSGGSGAVALEEGASMSERQNSDDMGGAL